MCASEAPASKACCVDSICSAGVTGTAGLSFFFGTAPVIATVMMTGVAIACSSMGCGKQCRDLGGGVPHCPKKLIAFLPRHAGRGEGLQRTGAEEPASARSGQLRQKHLAARRAVHRSARADIHVQAHL